MDTLGYIGGFTLCLNLIPQLYQSITTQSSKDINLIFLLINEFGLSTYMVYGFASHIHTIAFPAMISVVLNTALIALKFKHKQNERKEEVKHYTNVIANLHTPQPNLPVSQQP
tara:strand:- start:712 stop:1050 length:339 start_codon:yes stop_codon:yes gene_type:complete